MKRRIIVLFLTGVIFSFAGTALAKEKIHALFIPLADHYAALIAHAKYGPQMTKADYSVEMMKSWRSLRGKFMARQADVAFIICPMAMDMFAQKPFFRFISLAHRDGNALAVNEIFEKKINLSEKRIERKPTGEIAEAMAAWKKESGQASVCGVPSLLSTHTVVLYKYLKSHGKTLAIGRGDGDVVAKTIPPPKAPAFLNLEARGGRAATFEQSLPWADVVETGGHGKVAWYSKDVIQWPGGHVECIMIASDHAIKNKTRALEEVIFYLHKAGREIDAARREGGKAFQEIANQIHTHYIPMHTVEAIMQSLRPDLNVINYSNLNVDKPGLRIIMELAVESGVLKEAINIEQFADEQFDTEITKTSD